MEDQTPQQQEEPQVGLFDRMFSGDRALWIIIAALAVISLLVVYSSTASMVYFSPKAKGDTSYFFFNQLKFIVLGFVVMILVHRINYQFYIRLTWLLFWAALGFMLLTFLVGETANEASRWIRIPFLGRTFQPSDFLRVVLVALLAQQLAKRQTYIDKLALLPSLSVGGWKRNPKKNKDILTKTTLPVLAPVVLACGAIFIFNFSTAAITFITCLIMLYIGRVRGRELRRLIVLVLTCVVLLVSVMAVFNVGRARTWTGRLGINMPVVTLSRQTAEGEQGGLNIQSTQVTRDNLQREQAMIAVAAGKLIGKGPGNSTQRSNLPLAYMDFAYAFIVEEYGFIGAMVVLFLYLCIFFRGIVIFQRCGTALPSFLVLGLCLMITLQAFCNMLVAVGIFPVTGQPLPLVSLGGSSIVFTSLALGIILGVSRQMKEQTLDKPRNESLLE